MVQSAMVVSLVVYAKSILEIIYSEIAYDCASSAITVIVTSEVAETSGKVYRETSVTGVVKLR